MKFKIGQEVFILPSAVEFSIPSSYIGLKGVIVGYMPYLCDNLTHIWKLKLNITAYTTSLFLYWWVRPQDIRLCYKDKQLLFNFMNEK